MNQIQTMEGAPPGELIVAQRNEQAWTALAAHLGGAVLEPFQAMDSHDSTQGRYEKLVSPEGRIRWDLVRAVGQAAMSETASLTYEDRCLTEVDNLLQHRRPDGTYPDDVLRSGHINNTTRVIEPAMPFAVSTTFQEYIGGAFYWRRQTGLQVAASGYRYHKHEEALSRADVEVVEAIFLDEQLEMGKTSVLFSARMSEKDASREVARHEHLADDDSIRIQWIAYNPDGTTRGKYVQSILIRSDLREAWVAMLADPGNIFGKSITVEDPSSALSLMRAFPDMQLESNKLSEGVVTLLEATLPYISKPEQRREVMAMLPEYRSNQQRMQQVAEDIARRWDEFDIELANSLATGQANATIARFISDLGNQWNDNDVKLFARHQIAPGEFAMSRELAIRLEKAQESILCAQAALLVGNKQALLQVAPETAAQIIAQVEQLHHLIRTGANWQQIQELQRRTAAATAAQDIEVKGGCPGSVKGDFRKDPNGDEGSAADEDRSASTDRYGSRTFLCPTCNQKNERDYDQLLSHCRHCTKEIPRCSPSEASGKTEDKPVITVAQGLAGLLRKAKKSNLALAA